jgi:rare lipoprotein A
MIINNCNIFKLAIIIVILSLINACAPAYNVRVVDTPRSQNLKGHQKPYIVNGQRYEPLRDHNGFIEDGRASWYGKKFHGRKTSNGEIYNMYAMTAAHKTLPLGVFVKVTNKETGQQAVVRVNDRGPFVAGRIIDLSFAAAKKVGVVGPGTAPVVIEALGYRADGSSSGKTVYTQPKSYDIGTFAVQIGAFTVKANAERLAADMRGQYGFARVSEGWVNGIRYYRVWVGQFPSLEKAENIKLKFGGGFVVAIEK